MLAGVSAAHIIKYDGVCLVSTHRYILYALVYKGTLARKANEPLYPPIF